MEYSSVFVWRGRYHTLKLCMRTHVQRHTHTHTHWSRRRVTPSGTWPPKVNVSFDWTSRSVGYWATELGPVPFVSGLFFLPRPHPPSSSSSRSEALSNLEHMLRVGTVMVWNPIWSGPDCRNARRTNRQMVEIHRWGFNHSTKQTLNISKTFWKCLISSNISFKFKSNRF